MYYNLTKYDILSHAWAFEIRIYSCLTSNENENQKTFYTNCLTTSIQLKCYYPKIILKQRYM